MSERRCRKAQKRAIPFDCKGGAGHPGRCSPFTLAPTGNWLRPPTGTTSTCSGCSQRITFTRDAWLGDDDVLCPDGQHPHQPAKIVDHLPWVDSLRQEIDELTTRWHSCDDIDAHLGAAVQRAGQTLLALLDSLITFLRRSGRQHASPLERHSRGLSEALAFYDSLTEHESDASIDIFDRLGPGLASLVQAITLHHDPATHRGITVAELREMLLPMGDDLEVWVTAPTSTDGYLPLSGDVQQGHDDSPDLGQPERFVVLTVQQQ